MHWVVIFALLFVSINKFLQYTSNYHERWVSKLSLVKEIRDLAENLRKLIKERKAIYEENRAVSAQDNYARWTKNNRKISKLDKDIEQSKAALKNASSKQEHLLKRVKLIALTLPFLALKLLKGKTIVYDLPANDMFPMIMNGILTKGLLYIPLLPLNIVRGVDPNKDLVTAGVSLSVWLMGFTKVIDTVEFIINQLFLMPAVPEPKHEKNTTKEKELEPKEIEELKTTEAELD
ncbi:hypothetical protein TPHA_0K01640 [Tetrapisispora phaffii CBS 4417]|uniref:Golgi to ER traffic protein 1 n=1 Tax=Tetrapisispora phaffii (strain ATCC 24235 / CBS 4417 / NBRC 1672 / NRRL Y-8282 / UCD 70-5) TaxID=1071381 RepID=G8BZG9_TETPH|nr:hypothetical protein TPHA_0K01640 [Tetrapisispora phaffii CBS 4417]CCE65297.1 hypothetical protein TPHA_0K01640 [Tetrapisispora phaffii CBS 4417]